MDRQKICCFSGYRPEKLPAWAACTLAPPPGLQAELEDAIRRAFRNGCRLFVSGMSRGFDLWAADAVLRLRQQLPIQLLCAMPFDGQAACWDAGWKAYHQKVLLRADFVHSLAGRYTPDCFYVRNRFMVEGSSRLICWFDGLPGGTAFTLRCARRSGLEIDNLADRKFSLFQEACSL